MARYTDTEVKEAATELLEILKDKRCRDNPNGGDVYAKVTKVSRSGMSRHIEFYAIMAGRTAGDAPWLGRITRLVAVLTGAKMTDDGVNVHGCGMDMGWHALDGAYANAAHVLGQTYDSVRQQIQPHYI